MEQTGGALGPCPPGWPGASNSVDVCEELDEWSAVSNLSVLSDTEEEDQGLLVRSNWGLLGSRVLFLSETVVMCLLHSSLDMGVVLIVWSHQPMAFVERNGHEPAPRQSQHPHVNTPAQIFHLSADNSQR